MQITPTAHAQHCSCSHTPLESPALQTSSPPLTLEHLEKLFLKLIQATSKSDEESKVVNAQPKTEMARASRLEFKMVNEVYVSNCVQVPVS